MKREIWTLPNVKVLKKEFLKKTPFFLFKIICQKLTVQTFSETFLCNASFPLIRTSKRSFLAFVMSPYIDYKYPSVFQEPLLSMVKNLILSVCLKIQDLTLKILLMRHFVIGNKRLKVFHVYYVKQLLNSKKDWEFVNLVSN